MRTGKRFSRRRFRSVRRAAGWIVESLESRTLLSVGPIPTVPTPAGHWTFDEGSGAIANDSSGNGNTGSLGAGVSWTTGNVGTGAISVAGTATGVVTVSGPVVNTANSFTASAWVDLNSTSGYQTVVSIAGTNVAGFYLGLRQDTGTFSFARLSSDATGTATLIASPAAPATGTWYHIVGVDDATAGTLTLYVDGQSMGSVAYTAGWQAMGNTLIGHGFYAGGQVDYVNGSIDDVEMFSSALSAAQVAALDQPAAYSFDDGTGTTAADVSGHGNTLTLGSGASWAAGLIGSNSLAVNGTANGNAIYPSPVINTALPFSVSAWVNLNSVSGYQTFLSIDGSNTSAFYLQLRGDTGTFAFTRLGSDSDTATIYQADATSTPTTGTWYNLIGVNDVATNQLLLYVNGVLQSTVAYSGGWQGTGATVVGGGLFNGARSDSANGDIDDVHFFDSPLSAGDAALIGTNGNSIINIATNATGVTVSPNLFGAFMEDINFGGEGGIYNDEVRNSGFNDSTSALNSWAAVKGTGVTDSLASDTTTGPTSALTQSGKLTITSGVTASQRAGISNAGYFGVAVAPSTSYSVMFYAKATAGFTGSLTVDLESTTGTVYATATIPSITTSWAQYNATLTTTASTPLTATNRFVISTNSTTANGKTIWFGATYLYPPSYDNATNHLRIDLMQYLQQLQPAIFRVPGGNYLEGNTDATKFEWSNTVGLVQNRPGHYNSAWGYWSTDGMGLDEYLQMAEEVGAQPILAVFAGYTLNGSSDTGATLTADVTDAVDELHYVLDPAASAPWGQERAANGHPAPYNVNYVEIGNEDGFSSTYSARYPLFYNAIHAAFPQLKIIATSTSTGGSPYDVVDDHYYETPAWFEANSNMFNNTPRTGTQIFIGEYAANEGSPTNDMNSALGDASWLLGLERNSDLVTMSSYAPLWVNVNGHQWTPDLIGFNNTSSYGSPSYWAQVMLSNNHGTTVVSDTVSGATGLQTLVTKTGTTYYVTVINTVGTANTSTINLSGVAAVSPTASVTSLVGASSAATNSITNPTNIIPVTSTLSGLGTTFSDTFPAFSITILEVQPRRRPTAVATAAAATPSPAPGTTANLSVLGSDAAGESSLTYTWATTGAPPASVVFGANGTNASKNTTATFSKAGTYNFMVTITNPTFGLSTTSSVSLVVNQTVTSIVVEPGSSTVAGGSLTSLSAIAYDQFSNALSAQPTFSWGDTGGGSIDSSGNFTASQAGGSYSVTATANSVIGTAGVNVVPTTYSTGGAYNVSVNGGVEKIAISGGPTYSINISSLPSLTFTGAGTALAVDFTNGNAIPAGGLVFNPAVGANSLSVIGTSGSDTVKIEAAAVTFDSDPIISYTNLQSITINCGAGADTFTQFANPGGGAILSIVSTSVDTLNINGGTYTIPAPASPSSYPLTALNIANGARLAALTAGSHTNRTVIVLGTLSIGTTGQVDLGGNDMIVHSNSLSSIVGEISQGFNAGGTAWAGNGLTSSAAAATRNTALGVELNSPGSGTLVTTFDGQTVSSTDVLVKYTYFGDANLSGTINATDYQLTDNGFNGGGTPNGWFTGDFNYDGVVNGDDYALIDNAFNTQGGVSLAVQPTQQIAVSTAEVANLAQTSIVKRVIRPTATMPVVQASINPSGIFSNIAVDNYGSPESLADEILGLSGT